MDNFLSGYECKLLLELFWGWGHPEICITLEQLNTLSLYRVSQKNTAVACSYSGATAVFFLDTQYMFGCRYMKITCYARDQDQPIV